jgi:hypothetical protein
MAESAGGIVVGYDGSPGSAPALRWAAPAARRREFCYARVPEDFHHRQQRRIRAADHAPCLTGITRSAG